VKRWDIINKIIKDNDYKTYLEIGYGNGDNFNLVEIENKTGVDPEPDPSCDYRMTSDDFFKTAKTNNLDPYDIIFIDGNHNSELVRNDVNSALECLKPDGCYSVWKTNKVSK